MPIETGSQSAKDSQREMFEKKPDVPGATATKSGIHKVMNLKAVYREYEEEELREVEWGNDCPDLIRGSAT